MSTAEWMLRPREATADMPTLSAENHRHVGLVVDYCLLAQLQDPHAVLAGEEFMVDGVDFRLIHVVPQHPGILGVWCDYGHVPDEGEQACYRRLLESNASRFDGRSPVMALCPETGQVISSARLPTHSLTAEMLDKIIRSMARDALLWQNAILLN